MSAPALIVRIEVEGRPVVFVDALDEHEHARLLDWLSTTPSLPAAAAELLALFADLVGAGCDEGDA